MQETRVWFLGQEDPLEKEMATNSSILAWRIPWVEEPGRLHQFMGSHRVGHDWATKPPPPAMKYILIWVWSIDLNVHIYFPSCFSHSTCTPLPNLSLHHHKCICFLFLEWGGPLRSPWVRSSTEEPLYDFWSQPWEWRSSCLPFSQDAHSRTQWSSLWNMEILTHLERNRPEFIAWWSSQLRRSITSHETAIFHVFSSPLLSYSNWNYWSKDEQTFWSKVFLLSLA